MSLYRRLVAGGVLLLVVFMVGSAGYVLIEDLGALDAVYLTIITVSTVGFQEPTGGFSEAGQVFTILLVLAGVGAVFYTATIGIEWGLESFLGGQRQRRRMEREVDRFKDHVVLCGFGRVGSSVWQRVVLGPAHESCVVIEMDPDTAQLAREVGAVVVEGDATHDEVLERAGVDRAKTVIASVRHDPDNLVIVLSVKTRRPEVHVVARATELESEKKLLLAGADRVVAPQVVGAHRLAALATEPDFADFIDLMVEGRVLEVRVERLEVVAGAAAAGESLGEAQVRSATGTLVLAVQEGEQVSLSPGPDFVIKPGQVLYGVGNKAQVDALRHLVSEA